MSAAARRRVTDLSSQVTSGATDVEAYKADIKACRRDLRRLIDTVNCHPILVRLAWHDAGTFDQRTRAWPECGGANGSIRFDVEMGHGANAGLKKALGYLTPLKQKYPRLSWADIIQLGGATAVEAAGGPTSPCATGDATSRARSSAPRRETSPTPNRRFTAATIKTRLPTSEPCSTGWGSVMKRSSRFQARTHWGARLTNDRAPRKRA
jgi:catalase (peroxidase I)